MSRDESPVPGPHLFARPIAGAEDQRSVIEFLSNAASYGAAGAVVERIETHISIVFLVGDRAYKLKRAVRFAYLDYSQAPLREKYCRAELECNRRAAPQLYLRVRTITRGPGGGLSFDGPGAAVDWVVEMRRFDQNDLFDRRAVAGTLTPAMMRDLADHIAIFHQAAAPAMDHGGYNSIKNTIAANAAALIDSSPPLERSMIDRVNAASMAACTEIGALLDQRKAEGRVRLCHGDLHLRNICLIDGSPTIFDGIEFNDEFSCIDVLYDLAFLLMDLRHRGFDDLANLVFNRYLDRTNDITGLPALPLFMSLRAAIRAHVLIAQYRNGAAPRDAADAQSYLAQAAETLHPHQPCLIAIGGRSGSGKSTLAAALAPGLPPAPGARIIRSDVIRKTMFNVMPETHLPEAAYDSSVTGQVYQAVRDQAAQTLSAGYTAIADATFLSAGARRAIAEVAQHAGVAFFGFWLEGELGVLSQRLAARRNDASDADAEVLRRQERAETGDMDWQRMNAHETTVRQVSMICAHMAHGPAAALGFQPGAHLRN